MPRYRFKAKEGPGKTVERVVVASSQAAVLAQIEQQGLTPVWVREADGEQDASGSMSQRFRRVRIKSSDITIFTRQLASMIGAGVPVIEAMRSVEEQTEASSLRMIVANLARAIRDGAMFSEAIKAYPRWFSPLYVSMVEAGEAAGALDTMLERLADAREREDASRRQTQAAMAYPLLVAVVGGMTVVILLTFFMPRVMRLFDQAADLPMATRFLLGVSSFVTEQGYWILLILALLVALFRRIAALQTGRMFVDLILLRSPLLGRFLRDVEMARFARTFGLLIEAGLPIERVLRLGSNTLSNVVLRQELEVVRTRTVQQGLRLSEGLRASVWFPTFLANMVAVGEQTGHLEKSLDDVARYYEASVARQGRMAASLVEPLLLLFVGGIVGFIVFAMLMPIFDLGGQLR